MAESMLESRSTILPVFYDVNTSELGWTQGGDGVYPRTLDIHEEKKSLDLQTNKEKLRYDSTTLEKWRIALSIVAEISCFQLNSFKRDEGWFVDKVIQQALKKVSKIPLNIAKYPTYLDEKMEDVENISVIAAARREGEICGNCWSWWSFQRGKVRVVGIDSVLLQQQRGKARVVGIIGRWSWWSFQRGKARVVGIVGLGGVFKDGRSDWWGLLILVELEKCRAQKNSSTVTDQIMIDLGYYEI